MGKKLSAPALILMALATGCSNPVAPPEYGRATGTVCVEVSGIDTANAKVPVESALVNITPRALEPNSGVNLYTDQNGKADPWTSNDYAVLRQPDGSFDQTKTVEIEVVAAGWTKYHGTFTYDGDTLRVVLAVAQKP
jgi:hypothetical protein